MKFAILVIGRPNIVDDSLNEFLREVRERKLPIIFVNNFNGIPAFKNLNNDYVIVKEKYSAFSHTDLDLILQELKVDSLVLCGAQTHLDIMHTVRDAYQLGYKLICLSDLLFSESQKDSIMSIEYMKNICNVRFIKLDEF